jgi:hypothetical protein
MSAEKAWRSRSWGSGIRGSSTSGGGGAAAVRSLAARFGAAAGAADSEDVTDSGVAGAATRFSLEGTGASEEGACSPWGASSTS